MNSKNITIFQTIFNWEDIDDISEAEVQKLSAHLRTKLPDNFLMKCTWSYYKKCTIFTLEKEPVLFLKYVRDHYFFEVFGIHLTNKFFDPELGFKEYITGVYYKRKPLPFIMTSYEKGISINEVNATNYKYNLGRQCYLHKILSLYDVYDRHFIVREDDSVCRIDFGRSFENLHKKYLGFDDYLRKKKFEFFDEEFQSGYQAEKEIVKENLAHKRSKLARIIRLIKTLEKDYVLVYFEADKFVNRLIDHWSKIGFLKEAKITQCEWI
ncbi:MAG: hypothetical protein GF383_06035 [Candidatus Lokiarchaeota archaeon]|nr:hypothetical protein [Candidatus Lokiarchaeota archaeon]MBD3339502.1 hypothetical protein [Candidatus Lokiarchaeota archaeon]